MSRHVTPSSTPRLSSWKAHFFPVRLLLLLLLTLPIDSLSTKNRNQGLCSHLVVNTEEMFFFRICCSYMLESGPAGNWVFLFYSKQRATDPAVEDWCGFGRGLLLTWLWLDNTAPPPLPLFAVEVRDSKEGKKNIFAVTNTYKDKNTLANKDTLRLYLVVLHLPSEVR